MFYKNEFNAIFRSVNAFDARKFWCIFFLAILKTNPFSHQLSIKKVQVYSKFVLFAFFYGYVGSCRGMWGYLGLYTAM